MSKLCPILPINKKNSNNVFEVRMETKMLYRLQKVDCLLYIGEISDIPYGDDFISKTKNSHDWFMMK